MTNQAVQDLLTNSSNQGITLPSLDDNQQNSSFLMSWRTSLLVLNASIFIISTVGNGLVCFIILRRRTMKSVVNHLILNLAVADLIFTCICIPFDTPLQYMDNVWPYGAFMCKLIYPLQTETLFASVYTLVALSLTRYWAVVYPLHQQLATQRVKWIILVIWVISFVPVTPYMAALNLNRTNLKCEENWKDISSRKAYTVSLFFLQYVIPLTVISCANVAISLDLKKTSANHERNVIRRTRTKEARKVSRMLITVTALFAACVLPNNILWLWLDFGAADKHFVYFWETSLLGNVIVFSNGAMNPICYTVMNKAFRKEMRQLLFNCLHKKKSLPQ